MRLSPDEIIFWHWGPVTLNATIFFTWLVMGVLVLGSWLATRRMTGDFHPTRWQNLLEALVTLMRDQIRDISRQEPGRYLPFVGSLFLFIAASNLLIIIPGYEPPTGSLSTTVALAACVLLSVPFYGVARNGLRGYVKHYIEPSFIMLPFHIIGEFTRTVSLAVRLYGNIMSGSVIIAILLSIAPLFFPIIMQVLGLLVGLIQAYIFAVLAMVYIASAATAHAEKEQAGQQPGKGES
ncbi:F0F1 ATP synthase subunit A [Desulfoscipio gibsoniae]|uniref:ATP synthase subunit a n=1 Tax=Desulfoscipio gibsoniae DSM 7213 TaxID=767817 RepID=R4KUW2_9FIRM|nr:F0F1 ATP synthase subunit A [Desulfoscipio gibsoniae]AGL03411.1 alternate F1F0 ATPase, F0 subunit A [Desulfoscipio gibsoniae DSM 7213]